MACDGLAKAQAGRCRSHAARRPGRELDSFRQTEPTMEYISYSCGLGRGDHARAVARISKATCGTSNNPDVASLIRDGRARLAPKARKAPHRRRSYGRKFGFVAPSRIQDA